MEERDWLSAGEASSFAQQNVSEYVRRESDCGAAAPRRSFHNGSTIAATILRSFNTWAFKREQPSDCALMLRYISEAATRAEPVPFVVYWGKGPRSRLAEPDTTCLDYLAAFTGRLRAAYAPGAALNLIFTDTHARLNGHSQQSIGEYFADIEGEARRRGFETCWLSDLTRAAGPPERGGKIASDEMLRSLSDSAAKWYRGHGSADEGALQYFEMNIVEGRAIELAFPRAIFLTFSGSKLRSLFPERLPIFYMYSLRRGKSVKPWFVAVDEGACGISADECGLP